MPSKNYRYLLLLVLWSVLFYFRDWIATFIVYYMFNLPEALKFADSLWFFFGTFLKISLLLLLVIFLAGVVRSYFSPEKTRKALEGKSLFAGNVLAGSLGIVTPFCSCSAIPLFLAFVEAGIPLGVVFSFLIAAPMINEVAVVMLFSLFSWKVGFVYILSGLILAVLAGWIIGKLKLERWLQDWVLQARFGNVETQQVNLTFDDRIQTGVTAVKDIFSKIWIYLVAGIAVGAAVHTYVPQDYLASMMNSAHWYSVPAAVVAGVPLYSCSAGAVPIVSALIEKGVPLGTALAFMMSVIALSLPELIIMKKVLKLPFILTFVGIVTVGIVVVGYVMNGVL
ncbi:MAG: permease [Prolixibacteraceae bacterium]|jgi:hypothetical protein